MFQYFILLRNDIDIQWIPIIQFNVANSKGVNYPLNIGKLF